MDNRSLVQRLGYVADLLHLPLPATIREQLRAAVQHGKTYLGPTTMWGTGGQYDAVWQIVVNVPQDQLLSEVK